MPVHLTTTLEKLNNGQYLVNKTNVSLLQELYQFIKQNDCSQSHINNTLKTNMAFAKYTQSIDNQNNNLYDVKTKEQIISFLDTKIKNQEEDPDKRWITTWNDYLGDIKYFFRWLYNFKEKNGTSISDWQTPPFAQIKKKNLKF